MTRFINLLIISLLALGAMAQRPVAPDFAYPKTVSTQAQKSLEAALKSGDGKLALREALTRYIAQQKIGDETPQALLAELEKVQWQVTSPVDKTLFQLLRAEICNSVYSANSWTYDRRNQPLTPLPEDMSQWSGQQFRGRITELIDSVMVSSSQLKEARLQDYETVVTQDRETRVYYPTLFDFAAYRCIDIMTSWGNDNVLPAWVLSQSPTLPVTLKRDPVGQRILDIYTEVITSSSEGSAPYVGARIGRLEYLLARSQSVDNSATQYMNLFDELTAMRSPFAGDVLLEVPTGGNDYAFKRLIYNSINQFLKANTGYWRKANLEQVRDNLTQKSVSVTAPQICAPGSPIRLNINLFNVEEATMKVYDVSSSKVADTDYIVKHGQKLPAPVTTLKISADDITLPFQAMVDTTIVLPKLGTYIIIPDYIGKSAGREESYDKIYATTVALATSTYDETRVWALNAADGAPIEGAQLFLNSYRDSEKPLGTTGEDGFVTLKDNSGNVTATYGSDRYALPVYAYSIRESSPQWNTMAQGYPSLPLYHPGDTAEWSAVVYEFKGQAHRPVQGKELTAILRNPTSTPLDTLKVTTDRFGRVWGKFAIPAEGLSGGYSVQIGNSWAVSFQVSDYKLPTFLITLDPAELDVPLKGGATIHGQAKTYSGFPMADATVTLDLSVAQRPRWWMPSREISIDTEQVTTDSEGRFTIPLDSAILASSPFPGGYYTANVTVTSPSGESQSGSTSFGLGTQYIIKVALANNIDITGGKLPVEASVADYQDSTVNIPINYAIFSHDSVKVAQGVITSSPAEIDVKAIKPGKYTVSFCMSDSSLAVKVSREVVLYNPKSKETPLPGTLLWSPQSEVAITGNNPGNWLYAVDCQTNLLVTLTADGKILSQRWEKASEGMHTLSVTLPDAVDTARLNVSAVGKYRSAQLAANVTRTGSAKGLKFTVETMRDRLVPGSTETWRFRITDLSGRGRESAVIADMYNTALDALASTQWQFTPRTAGQRWWNFNFSGLGNTVTNYASTHSQASGRSLKSLLRPDFQTYGEPLWGYRGRQSRYRTMALSGGAMVEEAVMEYDAGPMLMSNAKMAAPEMAVGATADALTNSEEEVAEEGAEQVTENKPFEYRDSNVPLALFRPNLTTEADGSLVLTFTLPNANTTWGFRAIAWTDSLLATNFSRDIVASKPVMVQPNLPRFLRSGDRATVEAMVMNNTDSAQIVATTITLFNPADGTTINEITKTDTLSAKSSATVGIDVTAPTDAVFIGYRVKSATADWADGEQTLLPILPATTPIIETHPFYMGAQQSEYKASLPDIPSGAKTTLQFCENPVWYVVTALPGIIENEPSTSPEAARNIFSAAVAAGILRENPVIATALREWTASGKSAETLTSMLERNDEFKAIMLSATPWMPDAQSDTERMARLSLLFDKKLIDRTIQSNISLLAKLRQADGGWAWCSHFPHSSQWATETVLTLMGRLVQLDYLPADKQLRQMIEGALKYDESEVRKAYNRHPDSDFRAYVHLHDLFKPLGHGPRLTNVVNSTVQKVVKGWRDNSLGGKAIDAQILYNHNYKTLSKSVLTSIRQFGKSSPEKGLWFPSIDNDWDKIATTASILRTFAMIEPGCPEIDGLRQWLIIQKGAQNWGSSAVTSDVVATFLQTSKTWLTEAKGSEVTYGGEPIKVDITDTFKGEYTIPITWQSGKELIITKRGDTPAWGAVYCQYTDSITSVKSASCPELSIEKALLLTTPGGETQLVTPATRLNVGDKVTIRLTVKCDLEMDYVTLIDDRPACLEPVNQMPRPIWSEGIGFYLENRDSSTRLFIDRVPRGTYILTYDMWVNNAGEFISGIATAQSQYAPRYTAHSAGSDIEVAAD